MKNLSVIEACYKKYSKDLQKWLKEDIITVDLELLQKLDLLDYHDPNSHDDALTRYFHVIESDEKITLINEEFVIWIVPEQINDIPITYSLIALNQDDEPQLELAFVTSGVYNTSKLVLRVLEKFLQEIQENEELMSYLNE